MKIWLVFKNADFTEGKGPMVYHSAHSTLQSAKNEINKHKGIGDPPKDMTLADWCLKTITQKRPDGTRYQVRIDGGWGGFEIREGELKNVKKI